MRKKAIGVKKNESDFVTQCSLWGARRDSASRRKKREEEKKRIREAIVAKLARANRSVEHSPVLREQYRKEKSKLE